MMKQYQPNNKQILIIPFMQSIQLSIPEPCHENWQNMSPTEQGRFCNACAKEVIDFSVMTDNELLQYFTKKREAKVCGRAYPDQLERNISMPVVTRRRWFRYWNYAAAFFLLLTKTATSNAQTKGKMVAVPVLPNKCNKTVGEMMIVPDKADKPVIISGKVTDENGDIIQYATVMIKSGKVGTMTDVNGNFKLTVSTYDKILVASAVGYKTQEYIIADDKTNALIMKLALQQLMMGAIISGKTICTSFEDEAITERFAKARLEVIDEKSGLPVSKASIIFAKKNGSQRDTGYTDNKGVYTIKRIKNNENINVSINSPGFKESSIELRGESFERHKEIRIVKLVREPKYTSIDEVVVTAMCVKRNPVMMGYTTTKMVKDAPDKLKDPLMISDSSHPKNPIVLGGILTVKNTKTALLIVDDLIRSWNYLNELAPENIASVSILKGAPALAIYGSEAKNGVIIVTTKKKNEPRIIKNNVVGTMINKVASAFKANTIKIFPNPVQKGNAILISLDQKQTGDINIRVTNVSGNILLNKRSTINGKELVEKIQTGASWASGVYYINVYDGKDKLINSNSFIVL